MKPIRIAVTKGRLEKGTIGLFDKMGFDTAELVEKGRRLILPVYTPDKKAVEVVLAKSADVITYVNHGVCDLGIVGKDTIAEYGGGFYEVVDLGFGRCRFVLAAPDKTDFYAGYAAKTVATKYPNVSNSFFEGKGMDVRIIKVESAVELAPLLGLSDAIVDLVETGRTLKENGLKVVEDIMPVSARLIANIACMKLHKSEIEEFIKKVEENALAQ
jgi:ATP phosphoribosyltransferase